MTYEASRVNRSRATKAELEARRDALYAIVSSSRPMTVRQTFYQAEIRGLVEKTEAGYDRVQRDLAEMRRSGRMPYGWIADFTRWQRKPRSFDGIEEALQDCAALYRKDLWRSADAYVEIWIEKEALTGVIYPITGEFDVPLMAAKGYASLSFLHGAAAYINKLPVPAFIYHLGDFDPSGVNAGEKIEETLRKLASDTEIVFERLAVTPGQIAAWNLPTRPTKTSDSRSNGFGDISVELDAIDPAMLRELVRTAIERHLPPEQFNLLKAAEESERQAITAFVEYGREGSAL